MFFFFSFSGKTEATLAFCTIKGKLGKLSLVFFPRLYKFY